MSVAKECGEIYKIRSSLADTDIHLFIILLLSIYYNE